MAEGAAAESGGAAAAWAGGASAEICARRSGLVQSAGAMRISHRTRRSSDGSAILALDQAFRQTVVRSAEEGSKPQSLER
jgi:hypothetical protein